MSKDLKYCNSIVSHSYDSAKKNRLQPEHFAELLHRNGIENPKVAFIGGGKMATCIVEALKVPGLFQEDSLGVSVKTEVSKVLWQKRGYRNVFTSNSELLSKLSPNIIFLAVKPQAWQGVVLELPADAFTDAKLVISLMAGITIADLQRSIPAYNNGFIRMLPNTPARCGAGTFLLCGDKNTTEKIEIAKYIASVSGTYVEIEEKQFDAATSLAGCGPAFIFTVIDAMADGGVANGLNRSSAVKLAAQAVLGAAQMMLVSEEHPGKLKDEVCTPSGATIAGIRVLEKFSVRHSFIEAVCASKERIEQLQS